jgi:hypothetical protein
MHNKFLVGAIGMSIPCEGESDDNHCPNGTHNLWFMDFESAD